MDTVPPVAYNVKYIVKDGSIHEPLKNSYIALMPPPLQRLV